MPSLTATHAPRGLEGIVATNSSICYIDGEQGVLAYRGIDIHELADRSNFEEVCYLLWYGKLPTENELKEFRRQLAEERKLDPAIIELLRTAPKQTQPMHVLRTAVSALSFYDPEDRKNDHDANLHKAFRLTSQIAMIVAAYDRVRKGKKVVEPDPSLSHAANFLLLLNGTKPSETAERALDMALILHADHELNASTFAARVVAATLSDIHSAVTAAIGALKGPLHGGANEAVFHILQAIDKAKSDPLDYIKGMLAQKKKIPGFGHRVYHTEDPRATHLRKMSEDLGKSSGQSKWFEMSHKIEEYVKAEKKLNANVDFYSASTYQTLGIDVDLFTPIFAVSRISGWAAHVIEQLDDNRLIRPRADYVGPAYPQRYLPMGSAGGCRREPPARAQEPQTGLPSWPSLEKRKIRTAMRRVYLDNNATTPVLPEVIEAMQAYFGERFGNASSIHHHGQETRAAVERARESVATLLGCRTSEIVFTSGGTEGDNLAIFGVTKPGQHVISSTVEHHAVLNSCKHLEESGCEVTYVPVNDRGQVDPDDVRRALRPNTRLITIMMANNETGVLHRSRRSARSPPRLTFTSTLTRCRRPGRLHQCEAHGVRSAFHLRPQDERSARRWSALRT